MGKPPLKSWDVDQTFALKVVWGPDDSSSLVHLRLRKQKLWDNDAERLHDFCRSLVRSTGNPSDNELENSGYKIGE